MRISAWATVAAIGFAGSILAAGCVVGSDDDETDGGAGTSGKGGAGGSGGSAGSSGSGGSGGSAGSGGSGGSGGSAGTGGGAGVTCDPETDDNACSTCMKTNCCEEFKACGRDADCAGANGMGELYCINTCVLAVTTDGGVASPSVLGSCASQCAVRSTVADATNDAVACMANGAHPDGGTGADCLSECLQGN